jgi:hypothetical protein
MSIIGSNILAGASGQAAGGGYAISRSLRFNSSDSAYLGATFGTPTDQDVFTLSMWVKRSALGSTQQLFGVSTNHSFGFTSGDALNLTFGGSSALTTTALFRDPSACYHVVWEQNGTAHELYVNDASVGTATATSDTFNTAVAHQLGAANTTNYFNGYLADIHFIDGQALDPTSFGEFDATTGVWVPKAYTGSYGTNGFRLDFADNASTTTIGYDAAGSNDWTANNFSVTAGAGNDSLVDVPTNGSEVDSGLGGNVRGNYCTWNPLNKNSNITLANGNLDATGAVTGSGYNAAGTFGLSSGKWYWEIIAGRGSGANNGGWEWGIAKPPFEPSNTTRLTVSASGWGVNGNDGALYSNNSSLVSGYISGTAGSVIANGDTVMVAYDADSGKLWLGKNGTWGNNGGTGDPAAGTNAGVSSLTGTFFPVVTIGSDSGTPSAILNAGARSFAYTAPSGFKALNTANLPAPLVTKPSDLFDVKLYTGNGGTQTISGLGFSPDLVWIKSRSAVYSNHLVDVVRGGTKALVSDSTASEYTSSNYVTSFDSSGFSIGNEVGINNNGTTYVGWTWDAGSSTVTNTQGSISSQVRANASAGFSVVTYTGNATAGATVGHGLGVQPEIVIGKNRGGGDGWFVWSKAVNSGGTAFLKLNTTDALSSTQFIANDTAPNSTVITLGSDTGWNSNQSPGMVLYCFAPVAGYSSFGSYTGNGSADGPFVYTGFRIRCLWIKETSGIGNWLVWDAARSTFNIMNNVLIPNSSSAELSNEATLNLDVTANGFKIRSTSDDYNGSAFSFIYCAWAESPFQYARAR